MEKKIKNLMIGAIVATIALVIFLASGFGNKEENISFLNFSFAVSYWWYLIYILISTASISFLFINLNSRSFLNENFKGDFLRIKNKIKNIVTACSIFGHTFFSLILVLSIFTIDLGPVSGLFSSFLGFIFSYFLSSLVAGIILSFNLIEEKKEIKQYFNVLFKKVHYYPILLGFIIGFMFLNFLFFIGRIVLFSSKIE